MLLVHGGQRQGYTRAIGVFGGMKFFAWIFRIVNYDFVARNGVFGPTFVRDRFTTETMSRVTGIPFLALPHDLIDEVQSHFTAPTLYALSTMSKSGKVSQEELWYRLTQPLVQGSMAAIDLKQSSWKETYRVLLYAKLISDFQALSESVRDKLWHVAEVSDPYERHEILLDVQEVLDNFCVDNSLAQRWFSPSLEFYHNEQEEAWKDENWAYSLSFLPIILSRLAKDVRSDHRKLIYLTRTNVHRLQYLFLEFVTSYSNGEMHLQDPGWSYHLMTRFYGGAKPRVISAVKDVLKTRRIALNHHKLILEFLSLVEIGKAQITRANVNNKPNAARRLNDSLTEYFRKRELAEETKFKSINAQRTLVMRWFSPFVQFVADEVKYAAEDQTWAYAALYFPSVVNDLLNDIRVDGEKQKYISRSGLHRLQGLFFELLVTKELAVYAQQPEEAWFPKLLQRFYQGAKPRGTPSIRNIVEKRLLSRRLPEIPEPTPRKKGKSPKRPLQLDHPLVTPRGSLGSTPITSRINSRRTSVAFADFVAEARRMSFVPS